MARRLVRLARIESAIQAVRDAGDEAERLSRIHSAWDLVMRAARGLRMPETVEQAVALCGEGTELSGRDEVSRSRAGHRRLRVAAPSSSGPAEYVVRNGVRLRPEPPKLEEP